ncbi:MAG: hypothetical protein V4529_16920 [Gemmatimonadota bacterium]
MIESMRYWDFWDWERLVFQIVFFTLLVLVWRRAKARDHAIQDVRDMAASLEKKATDLGKIVEDYNANLFDCETCPIRHEVLSLHSDPTAVAVFNEKIMHLAMLRKKRTDR